MGNSSTRPTRRFGITRHALGNQPFVDISEAEFGDAHNAIKVVLVAIKIEAIFDVLIENFVELEKEIVSVSVTHMILTVEINTSLHKHSVTFSRRLNNLLSAARAYLDQVAQLMGDLGADSEKNRQDFRSLTSREYDARFGYRFMEALRNYAQHGGLPVQRVRLERRRIDEFIEFGLQICTTKEGLVDNSFINANFRRELADRREDHFSLHFLIRDYIAGLSAVHEQLRALHKSTLERALSVIRSARAKFKEAGAQGLVGASIVEKLDDGTIAVAHGLSENMDRLLNDYTSKNQNFGRLEFRYVTSKDNAS
jgi:hypothetical protein